MSSRDSISRWIVKIKQGDEAAAQTIWDRCFPDMVRLARTRLRATSRRMADEEDVALSALNSFCRAAQQGRFPDLAGSDGLWRLLSEMAKRKAVDLIRRNQRRKAGETKCGVNPASPPQQFCSSGNCAGRGG